MAQVHEIRPRRFARGGRRVAHAIHATGCRAAAGAPGGGDAGTACGDGSGSLGRARTGACLAAARAVRFPRRFTCDSGGLAAFAAAGLAAFCAAGLGAASAAGLGAFVVAGEPAVHFVFAVFFFARGFRGDSGAIATSTVDADQAFAALVPERAVFGRSRHIARARDGTAGGAGGPGSAGRAGASGPGRGADHFAGCPRRGEHGAPSSGRAGSERLSQR